MLKTIPFNQTQGLQIKSTHYSYFLVIACWWASASGAALLVKEVRGACLDVGKLFGFESLVKLTPDA